MPGFLTTHVLDTANGKPADGLEIELARFDESGERHSIKTVRTNDDGRTDEPLLPEAEFETGEYEIVFSVAEYFAGGRTRPTPLFSDGCRYGSASQIPTRTTTCRYSPPPGPTAHTGEAKAETAKGVHMSLPEEGQQFPAVQFTDEDGRELTVQGLEGRKTVLYFYPKDDSPGCTKEACAFRDRMQDYRREDLGVYGVSTDSPESHKEFREKHGLNLPLLTDDGGAAATELGVLNEQGRAARTTFLLGAEGEIEKVYPEVSPETHADEILEDAGKS